MGRPSAHDAWEEYGADQFRRVLTRLAPHHARLIEKLPSLYCLRQTWIDIAIDHIYGEWVTLSDDSPYFPFDDVFGGGQFLWRDVRPILLRNM